MSAAWQFEAIGTNWEIETPVDLSAATKKEIIAYIEKFERVYSRFRDDSIVAMLSRNAGEYELDENSIALSEFYRKLYDATDGAMSPFIGRSLEAAGYGMDYSLTPDTPQPAPEWKSTIRWHGGKIIAELPVVLDIGAAGKGVLVDKVSEIIEKSGVTSYVIDASGDVRHRGDDTQRIGLENPHNTSEIIGIMELQNASLCASATNRRRWADGWHHVLDGRTGEPVTDIIATWVIAENTMLADGLSTALFFVGGDRLLHIEDFQYVRLHANGKIENSKNFVGQLYI